MTLFWSGLKAGCLTFGGAYTAIPLLQRDAVTIGSTRNARRRPTGAVSSCVPGDGARVQGSTSVSLPRIVLSGAIERSVPE